MCGICGFLLTGASSNRRELEAMADTLVHRGPDDCGYFLETASLRGHFKPNTGTIGLAHRRLSIIDLSPNGHQPMFNEDGNIALVFNGEIYNFKSLRRTLEERGHSFISRTDSEVIIHGYEEWGESLLQKMNGMFALTLWDRREQKLILARDRVGIKPLYYYQKHGVFLFASELKALQAHPLFDKAIDLISLGQYLSFSYVPAPRTIYRDACKLLPGEYIIVKKDRVTKQRFWDLTNSMNPAQEPLTLEKAVTRCEELLLDSVRLRLVSDRPLGAFLSGGYDSSVVVAMMREAGVRHIKTFTIGFKEDTYNEAPFARRIANHLGTDHHELVLTPAEAIATLEKLSLIYDEPFGDSSGLPTYLLSELTRKKGMIVALSGDGGDELFRGYTRYLATAKMLRINNLPSAARRLGLKLLMQLPSERIRLLATNLAFDSLERLYHHRMSAWKQGRPEALVRYDDPSLEESLSSGWLYNSRWPQSRSSNLDKIFEETVFYKTFMKSANLDPIHALSLVDIHTYMVDSILTKVDRASMAVSLEVRVPLLDHRMVEFAASLPTSINIRDGGGKYLIKAIANKFIPQELLERPKHGFSIPGESWLRGPLKSSLTRELSPEKIKREALLDPDMVSLVLAGFLKGKFSCARLIWSLFMFELWMKNHHYSQRQLESDVVKDDLESQFATASPPASHAKRGTV